MTGSMTRNFSAGRCGAGFPFMLALYGVRIVRDVTERKLAQAEHVRLGAPLSNSLDAGRRHCLRP